MASVSSWVAQSAAACRIRAAWPRSKGSTMAANSGADVAAAAGLPDGDVAGPVLPTDAE